MFSDLPRYSLKSIRRCPNCDVFNGYKAKACKNDKCRMEFKTGKKKTPTQACQIVTDDNPGLSSSSPKLYSVRIRCKGPDYRTFVELNQIMNTQTATNQNVTIVSARCNVTACVNLLKSNIKKDSSNLPQCKHIQAAMNSTITAEPLVIKQKVFDLLDLNDQMKQDIYQLYSNTSPLVQRITKHVMVVKSKITKGQHLGYLHVSFVPSKKGEIYSCSCEFNGRALRKRSQADTNNSSIGHKTWVNNIPKHCIHFYLCICAFCSDKNLYKEYEQIIRVHLPNFKGNSLDNDELLGDQTLFSGLANTDHNLLELTDDMSHSPDMSENVLFPLVSQMIQLPDGNSHMIELKSQLDPQNNLDRNESSDVIIYKPDFARSEIVKTCDVMLANNSDTVSVNKNMQTTEPLDIQIMLSDNGNLINLSDVIEHSSNSNNSKTNLPSNSQLLIEKSNDDIVNIQQLAVQTPNLYSDIYTISGDETSLKIISLEEYDSLFPKTNSNNIYLNPDCNDNLNYNIHNTLLDNALCSGDHDGKGENNIYIPDDDGLFSFDCDTELTANILQNEKASGKKGKKRKKNVSDGCKSSNLAWSDNNGCIEFLHSVPTLHINNQAHDNSLDSLLPAANIITLNSAQENVAKSSNSDVYSKKYFIPVKSSPAHSVNYRRPVKLHPKRMPREPVTDVEKSHEERINFEFLNWLSSVTENINQTMHYQFKGKPDPLIFHIPENFYECFLERVSNFGKKKRLPNSISIFERKKAIPLGKFTMYTWKIINIFHVKNIFDTNDIALEITRFFKQNLDGTYTHIENPYKSNIQSSRAENNKMNSSKKKELVKIIPRETFVTYLKVGNTSAEQNVPTPFCIEWIPNILPITKVGELRIKFEYGHKDNYVPEQQNGSVII